MAPVNPPTSETREEQIRRYEVMGVIVSDCPGCVPFYAAAGMPVNVFEPLHRASRRCESGGLPHCTCSICF